MRAVKVGAIVANLALAGAVLSAHSTSSLFPAIPLGLTIATIAFLPASYQYRHSPLGIGLAIASIITIAVLTRWFIFQFPESLIGFDPHRYALWTDTILQNGFTDSVGSGYYSTVPLFLLLPAITAHLLGVNAAQALGVYPMVYGVLLPLLAVIFASRMTSHRQGGTVIAAAMVGGVITIGISYSYWPVAQSLSSLLLCISLFAMYVNDGRQQVWKIIIIINLIAMTFTHKIPLALLTFFLFLGIVIYWIRGHLIQAIKQLSNPQKSVQILLVAVASMVAIGWLAVSTITSVPAYQLTGLSLAIVLITIFWFTPPDVTAQLKQISITEIRFVSALSLILVLTQYILLTTFFATFLFRFIAPLREEGLAVSPGSVQYSAASQITPGLLDPFHHRHDMLLLVLLLGLVTTWVIFYTKQDWSIPIAVAGGTLLLTPFALTVGGSVGIGAHRLLLNILPLIAALVAIGFVWIPDRYRLKQAAAIGLVAVIVFQGFGVGVVPDYPNTNRDYLTSGEVEGKAFAHDHIEGSVHTDYYYAQESIVPVTPHTPETANADFVAINDGYLNATVLESNPQHIAQRTSIDGYRFNVSGYWGLHWDPVIVFDGNRSRVYSNGDVNIYSPGG